MKKLVFLSVLVLGLAFCPNVLATDYYVDYINGSDSNIGTSPDSAWKRCPGMQGFSGSPSSLSPGDVVYFKKGVIWPSAALPLTFNVTGTAGNPITYTTKKDWGAGDYATFDAENVDTWCIYNNPYDGLENYIIVDGLELRNPAADGVRRYALYVRGNYNIVRRCKLFAGGIRLNGEGDLIENNIVDFNNLAPGAEVSAILTIGFNGIIARNEIINFNYAAIKTGGGSQNLTVEKNYIHSPGSPGTIQMGICYRSTDNSVYRYNIIDFHGVYGGRGMSSWSEGPYYSGNKIYNNMIIMNGTGYGIHDGLNSGTFRNNIIYDAATGYRISGDNNNIDYSCAHGCTTVLNDRGSGNIFGGNNITTDSVFVDVTFDDIDDFKFQSTSPCKNTGIVYDDYHNGINTDYWGAVVAQGSNPDIGAYEYVEGGNQPPDASFNADPTIGDAPLTVQFTDTSADPDGTIVSWNWDFGDGGTSTEQNPGHTYNSASSYTVTLTVADNDSATDSASTTISVSSPGNQPPNASFNANPSSGEPPLSVQFTDASIDPDGTIASWNWDFGDGGTSTAQNPSYTYNAAGTHTATLTVTDDDDATDSASTTIFVSSGEKVSIYIEAESGTLDSPMVIGNDPNPTPCGGGEYVYAPASSGDTTNPTAEAAYNIDIPYAGDYYLWLRMYGPANDSDAMYIGFNGKFDRVYPTQIADYEWVRVETTHGSAIFVHTLSAGTNQINIGHGEELARVDIILVTDDPDFVPSGIPADITPKVPSAPTGLGVSVSE